MPDPPVWPLVLAVAFATLIFLVVHHLATANNVGCEVANAVRFLDGREDPLPC